jgi:hypothetical protein
MFFAGTQQGKKSWVWRGFLWVGIMEDEIFEHSITFAALVFLGRCLPATYCREFIMGSRG